jgi:RNA polymerase sigma-70 factor (ECF subfamily)
MPQSGGAAIRQTDQEFMDGVYTQYSRTMYHIAKKYTSDLTIAEDIVQDVILKLISKIPTLRRLGSPALNSYIVISVKNTSIDMLRQRETDIGYIDMESFDEEETEVQNGTLNPEDMLLLSERVSALKTIWTKLSEKDRDILTGRYIMGLNDQELAGMLCCKPSGVRMLLTRARRRALTKMKEVGYDEA